MSPPATRPWSARPCLQPLENRTAPAITVQNLNDGGPGSLREAVTTANGLPGADIIDFKVGLTGTISLTTGQIAINGPLTITGPGASTLSVSGNKTSRIFNTTAAPANTAISVMGLTLRDGTGTPDAGAILAAGENLVLADCVLSGNIGEIGGALRIDGGSLAAQNCSFTGNFAYYFGGAIFSYAGAKVALSSCTISGNTSPQGGGVNSSGYLSIAESTIADNSADYAGGIFSFGGTLTIRGSTISSNSALRGGGINTQNACQLTIENSTISGNTATETSGSGRGGGLAMFNFNTAGASFTMRNSTVTNNTAMGLSGGGVHLTGSSNNPVLITSSIVSGNFHPPNPDPGTKLSPDFYGPTAAQGATAANVTFNNTLVGIQTAHCAPTAGNGNQFGTAAMPLDAQLGLLAANGGPTPTHALLPGSPCVNAGSNPAMLAFDQRGPGFARQSGAAVDIGAFETQSPVTPAKVASFQINDGTPQRSRVTSLKVTFDNPLTLPGNPADAFQLKRNSDSANVTLSAVVAGNDVTLTFTGGAVEAGSLADGRYTLTILAAQATNLDGNGDGTPGDDYVLIGDPAVAPKLYRLFGDSDGDNDVDTTDFGAFRAVFGGTSSIFDFDNDGDVDTTDFGAFRGRFGASV